MHVSAEQYVKGEEIQEQTHNAQKPHDDEGHANGLKSLWFDFDATGRDAQLLAAALAVVGFLCVFKTARRAKHKASISTINRPIDRRSGRLRSPYRTIDVPQSPSNDFWRSIHIVTRNLSPTSSPSARRKRRPSALSYVRPRSIDKWLPGLPAFGLSARRTES